MRLLFIFLFFVSFKLCSQQNSKSTFSLKPLFGISGCQIHGDSYDGYDKLGFVGGFNVNAYITKKTSVEIGFTFSQKGSKHNPSKSDASYYFLNLNYIEVPLYLHFYLNTKYFITLGGYGAYLVSYYENRDYVDQTGWYNYNSYDFGAVTGLGRNLGEDFLVELRFTNSLVPIRDFNSNTYYSNPIANYFNKGYYSNTVTFIVCYKLNFSKSHAKSSS